VQISHIKLGTVGVWHKAAEAIALIEAARARGVDITADEYPYNAWSSTITVLVPDKRYDYPPSVERALADVGGAANVLIVRHAAHPEYEFKTLDAVAKSKSMTAVEMFIQIVKDGGAGVVCTSMVDDDMRAFYQRPWVMVASDGGIGARHPRGAGTFPRVLGKYVRGRALAIAARGDPQDDERAGRPLEARRSRPDRRRGDGRHRDVQPQDDRRSLDVQRPGHPARPGSRRCSSAASWCGTAASR
jgi:N-acyl-D-aspartate/D-glutamate deacylase